MLPIVRRGPVVTVLALALVATGCGTAASPKDAPPVAAEAPAAPAAPAAVQAAVPLGAVTMPTQAEVSAAWQARPDYVKALPSEWQGAYAFALARPDVLQWLPCYCGCSEMGHGSNLDCFFQKRDASGALRFEEHASYCDICVETANLAQAMLRDGKSMVQIRAAVDAQFGGSGAPGTDTALPPA
jgi:hypothetical protein